MRAGLQRCMPAAQLLIVLGSFSVLHSEAIPGPPCQNSIVVEGSQAHSNLFVLA